jgi:SAM-dependent methyltransferase
MRSDLLARLRDPVSQGALVQFPFEYADAPANGDVRFGVLRDAHSGMVYPILDGVPQLLPNSIPKAFVERFKQELRASVGPLPESVIERGDREWSFSTEWDAFFSGETRKTWGWDVDERVQMFLLETQLSAEDLAGALILDAGCGNGLLSEALTSLGATVIAIDYSTSVFAAERHRTSSAVHFVRGDLAQPPFERAVFDVVFSSGVLHHTPNTRNTFMRVAQLTRPGGKFYVWLYRRSRRLRHRLLHLREDLLRPICSRLPGPLKAAVVHADAAILWSLTRAFRTRTRHSFDEHIVGSYDLLTPRFAWHHHTPYEVSAWFLEAGYSAPTLTHWDNPNGFGMVAARVPMPDTPGVNYGKRGEVARDYR